MSNNILQIHKLKYQKYKKKYINLKNKLKGGTIEYNIIKTTNDDFLNEYIKVNNSGGQNCGIYLNNNDPKKLIKCDEINNDVLLKLNHVFNKYPNYCIFPQIYNIYEYNNFSYTEMFKFDEDITNLLYQILPLICLDEMVNLGVINEEEKNHYFNIFTMLILKSNVNTIERISFTKELLYFYNNKEKLDELELLIENIKNTNINLPINEQTKNIIFDGFNINIENFHSKYHIKYYINNLDNIVKLFNHPNIVIDYNKYQQFYNLFESKFIELLVPLFQQIYRLKLLLINIGFTFHDDKFDNYAYILEDNPREHLGILWKTNKIGSKYFYVSFIDPASGLSKLGNNTDNTDLMRYFQFKYFSKYGQYPILNLRDYPVISYNNMKIIQMKQYDKLIKSLNLTTDSIKILSNTYTINDNFIHMPNIFENLQMVNMFVLDNNEIIDTDTNIDYSSFNIKDVLLQE